MSQSGREDLEKGENADSNQTESAPIQSSQPSNGEPSFGDSSGPLFSIYNNATEDEDNKMVKRWTKDADGILIFTGLFSAAVAALLAVTVQDLRPNSQDTSAFYLGNIYGVLADPNATRASIPAPTAQPPPFSAPRYAVWVNSLWFLSLVMSLSCALWATSLNQWARRYIRLTQPARCSPEKQARMRAFYANGVDEMHIPWAVEGLPTLLHLSLFLFFGGLAIFLFNVDREVFTCVVSWIGFFSTVYGLITLLPLIRKDSPYYAPLSTVAWSLYAGIQYVIFGVLTSIFRNSYFDFDIWDRCFELRNRYRGWMLGGVEKKAEEMALERSSEIVVQILGWTITALDNDDSLEKFFEAIPGLFNSKLANDFERHFSPKFLIAFWNTMDMLMDRTLSSNSVTNSVKSHRVFICRDIMNMIPCINIFARENLHSHFIQAPVSIEKLQTMARWFAHSSREISYTARAWVARNLPKIQERDSRWIALASAVYGSERDLRHDVPFSGDDVLLFTLIDLSRRANNSEEFGLVRSLAQFDIHDTLPALQHDFCTLWNEFVQGLKIPGQYTTSVKILRPIRRHYIALHQGTDAAPTALFTSADYFDDILYESWSYPLCNIASHCPDSAPRIPVPLLTEHEYTPNAAPPHLTSTGITGSQQVEEASIVEGIPSPPDPTTPGETGDISRPSTATSPALLAHTSTDTSPGAAAAALQDISTATAFSHPPEGTTQQDVVSPCAGPDISEISTTASMPTPTPTLAPVPVFTSRVPDKALASSNSNSDLGAASASNPLLPSSVVGLSVPTPSLSRVPPLQDAVSLVHLSSTTSSRPTGNTTLTRLRARGLVNTGNMSFANAVLQLLVHSPPFWNLFREAGDLKGLRGAGSAETGGGATPLVDATLRFVEEFVSKEELPSTQQPPQQAEIGKPREDEEEKKEIKIVDSFEPTYMYDAIKEKGQLKTLLDGKHEDAEEFLGLYLDALDEELVELHTYISMHKPSSTPIVEEEVRSAKGPTEGGKPEYTASSVESPISRIFGGRYRLTVRTPNRPDTVTTEGWRSLKLYFQPDSINTIRDALSHLSQPQPVQRMQVGQSSSSEASQQVLVEALPPVLVLHLERFLYDAASDGINKVSKDLRFAPELEIPLEIMALVSGKSSELLQYKLYGVLYHHGESAGSGHYTVDVLHPSEDIGSGESWLHIDDEAVSVVRHEDVFGGRDDERRDDRCVYMLFYCCTSTRK